MKKATIDTLLSRLLEDAPTVQQDIKESSDTYFEIDFIKELKSDYNFYIYLNDSGHIAAGARLKGSDEHDLFWGISPTEQQESNPSDKDFNLWVEEIYLRLKILLTHKTRIIQNSGILNHIFTCQFKKDHKWCVLSHVKFSKFNGLKAPRTAHDETIYYG